MVIVTFKLCDLDSRLRGNDVLALPRVAGKAHVIPAQAGIQ